MRKIDVRVDCNTRERTFIHTWRYIGYDECNYTTTPKGEVLLQKFGALPDAPYYVRVHHMFCNGNSMGMPKWGSTNVYHEDSSGAPIYDFTQFDLIVDTILKHGNLPFFELGFMPLKLARRTFRSSDKWTFDTFFEYKARGWCMPPEDYDKWHDFIYDIAIHIKERWGAANVEKWYFELWNEPDLPYYWSGTPEEFNKLFDYTEAALHLAMPSARLGGPTTTGPLPGSASAAYFDGFLKHCKYGENHITKKTGTRLDFITFHVKGGGFVFDPNPKKGHPTLGFLLEQVKTGCGIIKENGFADCEIVLSECDPDGWAAGSRFDNINHNFRNTEYYASYVAASYMRIIEYASSEGLDIKPLAWAFLFPEERCFEGTRAFTTYGVDKPVFNVFKMLSDLGDTALSFVSEGDTGENLPDVSGCATGSADGSVKILICSHHDDPDFCDGAQITLEVSGLGAHNKGVSWQNGSVYDSGKYRVLHKRIDSVHSNACTAWIREGSPDYPDGEQYKRIKSADKLETVDSFLCPQNSGVVTYKFDMPARSVSLIEIKRLDLY